VVGGLAVDKRCSHGHGQGHGDGQEGSRNIGRGRFPVMESTSAAVAVGEEETKVILPFEMASESVGKARVAKLGRLLESFEMYLCPHLRISDPVFDPELRVLVESDFERTSGNYICCQDCDVSVYKYLNRPEGMAGGCYMCLGVSRSLGSGESAMESVWLNSTHLAGKARED
jgi:hypothetical protein